MILHFTKNPFVNVNINEDTFDNLSLTHLNRLDANNQNGDYTLLINATRPLYNDFHQSITTEALERAVEEGKTITVDSAVWLLKQFASQKEIDIAYYFRPDTAEYEEFFPLGITEYTHSNKTNIVRLFERLEQVIQTHTNVLGNAMLVELQQKINAFKTARDSQLQAMGGVLQYDSESDSYRRALAIQLFRNLGTLVALFADNPERLKNFFPEAQSRSSHDIPTPTPIPPVATSIAFTIVQTLFGPPVIVQFRGAATATGGGLLMTWETGITNSANLPPAMLVDFQYVYPVLGTKTPTVTETTVGALATAESFNFSNNQVTVVTLTGVFKFSDIDGRNNNLDAASTNAVLITADDSGVLNGAIYLEGGTNAAPTGLGLAAKNSLIAKGWTVTTN